MFSGLTLSGEFGTAWPCLALNTVEVVAEPEGWSSLLFHALMNYAVVITLQDPPHPLFLTTFNENRAM